MTKELIPFESNGFYYSLRKMIEYIPLDPNKWSAFLTLRRITRLIYEADVNYIERVRNSVSSYESLEENMPSWLVSANDTLNFQKIRSIWSDDTTEWLKNEWSIGDNKNLCAFVDREDFMRSLTSNDHELSKYVVQFFEKCWNIACVQEKYQKWIVNQGANQEIYEEINFFFFKGDICVLNQELGEELDTSIIFKKKDAERLFTPSQLSDYVDDLATNVDDDCCLICLAQISKYGVEDDSPTYSVQDLVDFHQLPSDCLKYAISY